MIWANSATGSLSIQEIIAAGPAAKGLLFAVALICLAGFSYNFV